MLTVTLDIQDCLINVKTGKILHFESAQGSFFEVCLKFSEERAGFKAMTSPDLIRKSFWIPNEQYETQISLKKGSVPSSIKRN